jgi:hypothetical protein
MAQTYQLGGNGDHRSALPEVEVVPRDQQYDEWANPALTEAIHRGAIVIEFRERMTSRCRASVACAPSLRKIWKER